MRVTFPKTDASQLIDFLGLSLSLSPYRENFFTVYSNLLPQSPPPLPPFTPSSHATCHDSTSVGNNPLLQEKARCDAWTVSVLVDIDCSDFLAGFRFQLSIEIEKKIQREGFAKWQKPVPKAFCAQQSFITWKTLTVIVKRRLLRLRWIKRRFQYYTQLTTVYKYDKNSKRYKFYWNIYIYIQYTYILPEFALSKNRENLF